MVLCIFIIACPEKQQPGNFCELVVTDVSITNLNSPKFACFFSSNHKKPFIIINFKKTNQKFKSIFKRV